MGTCKVGDLWTLGHRTCGSIAVTINYQHLATAGLYAVKVDSVVEAEFALLHCY